MFENLSKLQPMSKKLEMMLRRSLIYRKSLSFQRQLKQLGYSLSISMRDSSPPNFLQFLSV